MTYAMTLDNSWELMTEEEMYDVNGGITSTYTTILSGAAAVAWMIGQAALAGIKFYIAFKSMKAAVLTTKTIALPMALAYLATYKFGLSAVSGARAMLALGLYLNYGEFEVQGVSVFGVRMVPHRLPQL